jgi:hypothetical protein
MVEGEAPTVETTRDEVDVIDVEGLVPSVLEWVTDATLVVHAIEEYRVVPRGLNADEMWELGKLTSERLGLLLKVYRIARRYGLAFEDRKEEPHRQFLLDGTKVESWHDAVVFEALVGPFFRLFYESFFRSVSSDVDALVRDLWEEAQRFIRFGQSRMAAALGRDERLEIEAAVEKWLPIAVHALGEVPADVDGTWVASGLRTRTSSEVRQDYLDEMATYLNANDLEIPPAMRDAVREVEVRWLGLEVAGGGRRDGPVRPASFAFTDRLRGSGLESPDPVASEEQGESPE